LRWTKARVSRHGVEQNPTHVLFGQYEFLAWPRQLARHVAAARPPEEEVPLGGLRKRKANGGRPAVVEKCGDLRAHRRQDHLFPLVQLPEGPAVVSFERSEYEAAGGPEIDLGRSGPGDFDRRARAGEDVEM